MSEKVSKLYDVPSVSNMLFVDKGNTIAFYFVIIVTTKQYGKVQKLFLALLKSASPLATQ